MPELWDTLDQAQQPQPAPDMWRTPYGVGSDAEMAGSPSGLGSLASGLYQYLGNLAKRNIGNAQTYSQTGEYNPAPAVEAATLPMGTGAIAGVPVKGAQTVLGAGPIRAYHGSPHDFTQFDASKIGTGEGAQAYGHGLYFAGNEDVARSYRDALAFKNQRPTTVPSPFGDLPILEQDPTRPGRMYEVNIHADPAQMLDWDKRLSQMSPQVQEAVAAAVPRNDFGRMFQSGGNDPYGWRVNQFMADAYGKGNQSAADMARGSAALSEAGIPGIRYLDAGSRGAGTGSSNYVVFDPRIVDILRKYGIAGLAPMAAGFGFPSVQGSNEQRM